MTWLEDLIARFVSDADDLALAQVRSLAAGGVGAPAAEAYLELCRLVGESAQDSAGLLAALDDMPLPQVIDRIGALVVACFAAVRADYPARPDAQAARAALSARGDGVIDQAGAAYGAEVFGWLNRLVGEAVVQVSQIAATRAPLVRVETGLSLPSSLIAYDLYGDPSRGADLVARNRTGTPMAMPVVLEALAV
ncbi:hypothetical protein ABLE91_16830 [Aquabacter sp. CN5-332]|uniref:hypothetical protein n=1 Tax=Aquabacter sp. CN5-332 TaxID=3156608 RepID=UPI0032B61E31